MENRRPPRSNSSGRKSYLDRGRSASSFRDGNTLGGGQNRKPIRSSERSREGKSQDRTARTGDSWRKDSRGGFNRKDSNRTGLGRYEQKAAGRSRTRPDRRDPRENEVKITSDAQITDGKLRGRTLVNTVSPHAVHTKRKLREVAFKIISRRVKAGRILDLGAGCGTIGIEAISRGAMLATFVERSGRTCSFLRRNLTELGIKDGHGEVVEMEILPFLIRAGRRKRCWDIVYFNIPESEERRVILDQLACGCALKTGGLLLFEHGPPASFPDQLNQLKRWRTVDQGETILSIYERI